MATKKRSLERVINLVGTSPLSFEAEVGSTLSIRRYLPSSHARPTIGGGFKTPAYIVYRGITKVGRVSPKDVSRLEETMPNIAVVVEVDGERKLLKVELPRPETPAPDKKRRTK